MLFSRVGEERKVSRQKNVNHSQRGSKDQRLGHCKRGGHITKTERGPVSGREWVARKRVNQSGTEESFFGIGCALRVHIVFG